MGQPEARMQIRVESTTLIAPPRWWRLPRHSDLLDRWTALAFMWTWIQKIGI